MEVHFCYKISIKGALTEQTGSILFNYFISKTTYQYRKKCHNTCLVEINIQH